MNKVEIYNSDYTSLNHAYIQIYESYEKLLEAEDADPEILDVLGRILMVFNPALDKIKAEMTVQTRYRDDSKTSSSITSKQSSKKSSGPVIMTGNFTGE